MTRLEMIEVLRRQGYGIQDARAVADEALLDPGMVVVHHRRCEVDDDDEGCTCEPVVVAHEREIATA